MEQLIQLVHDHPVLYDTSHEDYMRVKVKDDIWERIAKELNYTSGQMAKEQWIKLRNCYRDALRRQKKKKSAHSASAVRPWLYQKKMAFLIPFMTNRNTSSNFTEAKRTSYLIESDFDEDVDDISLEETFRNVIQDPSVSDFDLEEQANSDGSSKLNSGRNKKIKRSDLVEATIKRKDSCQKRAKTRDDPRKSISENEGSERSEHLYHFFMSMYNTTKNMPLSHQLRVKRKVFEIVSEAEEDILACNLNT